MEDICRYLHTVINKLSIQYKIEILRELSIVESNIEIIIDYKESILTIPIKYTIKEVGLDFIQTGHSHRKFESINDIYFNLNHIKLYYEKRLTSLSS